MTILGYEVRKLPPSEQRFKEIILDNLERNAKKGLLEAQIELKHHELLLSQAPTLNRTEDEIKGYEEAIKRDHKAINNWSTQLTAIEYERNKTN